MSDQSKTQILKAIDKMEHEAAMSRAYKQKIENRIERIISKKKEATRDEILNKKFKIAHEKEVEEVENNFIFLIFSIALIIVSYVIFPESIRDSIIEVIVYVLLFQYMRSMH